MEMGGAAFDPLPYTDPLRCGRRRQATDRRQPGGRTAPGRRLWIRDGSSSDTADEGTGPGAALVDVVLRIGDFPAGFALADASDVSVDFDPVPGVDGVDCPPLGIQSTDFAEGVVTGDPVIQGDPAVPPFTGG